MPLLSDPDEFVLRSGVRSGLKREFAFALKAQAELPALLGRTRSAKASPTVRPPQEAATKRIRRYDGRDAPTSPPPATKSQAEAPITADDPDGPKPDGGPLDGGHGIEMNGWDGSKGEIAPPPPFPPPRPALEKPLRTYTRKGRQEPSPASLQINGRDRPSAEIASLVRNSTLETPITIDGLDGSKLHVNALEKPMGVQDAPDARSGALEKDSVSEIPIVIDGQDAPKVDVNLPEMPFHCQDSLHSLDKNSASDASMVIDGPDGSNVESGLLQKNCSLETVIVMDGQDGSKVDSEPAKKLIRRFTRSVLNNEEYAAVTTTVNKEDCLVETPVDVIDLETLKMESNAFEKPAGRFMRLALKVTTIKLEEHRTEGPVTITDQNRVKVDESKIEYTTRRITRSAVKAEKVAVAENGSVGSHEVKAEVAAINGSLTPSPKKKMELKMSKKIAPTKLPTNVKELLATGLLDGLSVRYVACNGSGKEVGLSGVIKDGSILCSCDSCKGSKAVSAFQFELHAGSTKKHPSDFIYLENGKSLRDILKACTAAPLDMLEAAVQNAIGPVPPRKPSTCQKCKESFHTLRIGKFAMFCDSCLQLKQLQATPTPMSVADSSERSPRPVSVPCSSESASKCKSSNKNSQGRLTRKDIGLHKLVFMGGILPEGTEVAYYVRGKKLLEGYIKDCGIFCRCCDSVISPSLFEAHAGRAQRRKPYNNIYTSNGVSLHELSVSLSKGRKLSTNENDDLCSICADGGDLLCCDLCPRAFHKECVGLSTIPQGDYYCQYCRNLHQREKCLAHNDNAIAAGRVAGVDPIQQIFQRCIRIVKTPENDVGGCVLCRCQDFSKSKFSPRTVLLCDQCEKEYHVGCLKDHNMADLKELPKGEWFCCMDCNRIYTSLKELLLHGAEPIQGLCHDLIKKKHEEKGINKGLIVDVRWRLLSGKSSCADSKLLLSKAVAIFHESFDPIVDVVTGRDLIPSMVYGRTVRDQDYGGIYCAILTVDSSVVSAGILRVLGCEVAELPLVATHRESQGQGYFQALFSCIERLLGSLNVKHFLLPAADEAESIWIKKFGFSKITPEQVHEYAKGAKPLIFQGTSMLHKLVPHSSPEKIS